MKTGRLFLCLSNLQFSLCLEPFVQIQDMTEFLQDAQVREGTLDDVRRVLHLRTGICYSCSNTCLMEGREIIQVVSEIHCLLLTDSEIFLQECEGFALTGLFGKDIQPLSS